MSRTRRPRRRAVAAAAALGVGASVALAPHASAAIDPAVTDTQIIQAINTKVGLVTALNQAVPPGSGGNSIGVYTQDAPGDQIGDLPRDGARFVILSTGRADHLDFSPERRRQRLQPRSCSRWVGVRPHDARDRTESAERHQLPDLRLSVTTPTSGTRSRTVTTTRSSRRSTPARGRPRTRPEGHQGRRAEQLRHRPGRRPDHHTQARQVRVDYGRGRGSDQLQRRDSVAACSRSRSRRASTGSTCRSSTSGNNEVDSTVVVDNLKARRSTECLSGVTPLPQLRCCKGICESD